ncbi:MAG: LutB/LldF family L-lactate oxidation iron-sulfur protein [Chloroflexota bacterium]|nr:LutB/LldF family L-lactate oxidation iron-sulfur protein [Chloroflexota bacterium]
MTAHINEFRQRAKTSIADARLQGALEGATGHLRQARAESLADLPDVEALRDHFKEVRSATLARLAHHLETFERNALAAGAHVHWAGNAETACQIVIDIARQQGVTMATKSKSMATEEIRLNPALQAAGIQPVETDLGEWIVQLADEPPSHIVAPAFHMTRAQVAELFSKEAGKDLPPDDIPLLTSEARAILRQKFLASDMGISGGNIAVAETGSVVLVTNEGNGRMVTSLPKVHVAVVGIEKIAPTWDDAAVWLSLLGRSSTGQHLTAYTTAVTGPARPGDPDGPQEVHIVLLDNRRSHQLGTPYEEALQCIRCGACLNICPVYREVGGHAYGNPYSGPIGAVIAPLLFGLEAYEALPHASSLCVACLEVCPARIDLPRMLLQLRADEVDRRIIPWYERAAERGLAWAFTHPRLYDRGANAARFLGRPLFKDGHSAVPRKLNPAQQRRLPALAPRSFRQRWASGELEEER